MSLKILLVLLIIELFITPTVFAASSSTYTLTTLGTLGGERAVATSINNKSQIVGYSTTSQNQTLAFIYQDGFMTDLGTLSTNYSYSVASDINDKGLIVGTSIKEIDSNSHPYRAV